MKLVTPLVLLTFAGAAAAQDPCGTWSSVPIPEPPDSTHTVVEDVEALGADLAWAVGRKVVTIGSSLESQTVAWLWNGAAWSIVPTPSPSPYPGGGWCDLEAVEILAADDVWAAGTQRIQAPDGFVGSQILVLHWNGSQWSVVPAPVTVGGSGNFVDDIEAIAADDIWFVGDWLTFPPTSVALKEALAMHWDGSGFTIVPAPFFDNGTLGGHGLTKVAAVASDDVWAVGGGHDGDYVPWSYIVHWNGSQWTYEPGPTAGLDQRWYDVFALSSDEVYALGDYFDGSAYRAIFARWDASGWTRLPDCPVGGGGLHAFASDRVYASGNGIARFDGAGWTVVETFPGVAGPSALALEPIADCSLWAVGRQYAGGTIRAFSARLEPFGDPTTFCTGAPNSVGSGASIGHAGSTSIAAADLVLSAAGLPAGNAGLFFLGDSQVPQTPFGNGWRCIGGAIHRLPLLAIGATGAVQQAFPYAGSPVTPGSTWNVQFWYRDPAAGGAMFNASDALALTFAP